MNINACKEYRFVRGKLVALETGKEYPFYISENDQFYRRMKKYIVQERIEGLTCENINEITVEDSEKTLFEEKRFILKANMFTTDKNNCVDLYRIEIKNVKLIVNDFSKKSYNGGGWKLELCSLEFPYQTKIDMEIVEK